LTDLSFHLGAPSIEELIDCRDTGIYVGCDPFSFVRMNDRELLVHIVELPCRREANPKISILKTAQALIESAELSYSARSDQEE
jgi:hypothetical protein